jgi:hypothetical protein
MTSLENKYYVYALIDPINRIPFYIGKGCGNRAYDHLQKGEKTNRKKISYIQNIRALGFEPRVEMFATNMPNDAAYELEAAMIAKAKSCFSAITNICPDNRPPSRKGIKLSEETKQKISQSLKGKGNIAWKGRKHSEETKQKMAEGMRKAHAKNKFYTMGNTGDRLTSVIDNATEKLTPVYVERTETETMSFLSKL